MEPVKLTPALIEKVARDFLTVLREWIGVPNLRRVVRLNSAADNPWVCHTHDFCDANMAMDEALTLNGLPWVEDADADLSNEPSAYEKTRTDLFNAAWTLAKATCFWIDEETPPLSRGIRIGGETPPCR